MLNFSSRCSVKHCAVLAAPRWGYVTLFDGDKGMLEKGEKCSVQAP